MSVRRYMEKKLAEALSEPWGSRGLLRAEISELACCDEPDGVAGVLSFFIRTRSGEDAIVLDCHFEGLTDSEAVDCFLAEALSMLLASHASWPR